MINQLAQLDTTWYLVEQNNRLQLCSAEQVKLNDIPLSQIKAMLPVQLPQALGSQSFIRDYKLQYAYMAGAMANGIHSAQMVIALANAGMLGALGAGGLSLDRIHDAIDEIKAAVGNKTFAVNLLHNPGNPDWELGLVKMCIEKQVWVVEAAAYVKPTPAIVYYRIKGLQQQGNKVIARNRIIAKVSRTEVADSFLSPAPKAIVKKLLKAGEITEAEAKLAAKVPLADDITIEADSGGHTDHGSITCIVPQIMKRGNELQQQFGFANPVRFGVAGGLGCPESLLAAFSLGADYVVTGSINQACIESGTSDSVREALTKAGVADVISSPSADMFEMGAQVQTLKKGSMYGVRSQKLYNLYKQYNAIEDIPATEIETLEKQVFKQDIVTVWTQTQQYLASTGLDSVIETANNNPKKKMALIFQWYLGQSSKWAIAGDLERTLDHQIWCGPAMGACNNWLKGSELETPAKRKVVDIAIKLLNETALLQRFNQARQAGLDLPNWYQKSTTIKTQTRESNTMNTPLNTPPNGGKENTMKYDLKESKEYFKELWKVLPGGCHYNFGDPTRALVVPFVKGKNSRVWDKDGNEHLDLFAKFGALFVGHGNEEYNEKIIDSMQKLTAVDTCDLELEVCEKMVEHIPGAEKVRFCLSGTEAVQNVIRLARGVTGKSRFIRFHGHYNGNADNVIGGRLSANLDYPVPENFKGDMMDTLGRFPNTLQDQSFLLPWNDAEILERTLDKYGHEVAAVLMEPICMNGGGIFPKEGYLERAKAACEKHNVILIFDEVITGVRFGLGGAQKLLGVTPHLSTFGKALGGGAMPISAIAGRADIMDYYTKGKIIHAGTFNGYPAGLAAIKATFELVEKDPGCYDRMGGIMTQIADIFIKAAHANEMPMVIQGMPTGMVYHSQDSLVVRSEGYSNHTKMCDIMIREITKRYGIQFSPLSRIYSNMLMSQDDVSFFEERIYPAMANAKAVITATFPEGVV